MFELLFTHPLWAYRTGVFAFASAWPLWLLVVSIIAVAVLIAASLVYVGQRRQLGWHLLLPVGILQSLLAAAVLCLLWRPVLNVERVRDRENVLAVAIDASASMAYGDGERSRLQEVAAALQNGTLAKLEDTFEVRLFSFAQTTTPLDSLESIAAPGPQTRIGDSLSEERLTELASYGVPIHTVGVGPEQVAGDLELERLDVPSTAPVGSTVPAQVGIRHDGAAKTRLRVYDQETLVAARDIELPSDTTATSLTIDLPAGEPGT